MERRGRLAIYPFKEKYVDICRNMDLLDEYNEVVPIVVEKYLEGKDASIFDEGDVTGCILKTNLMEELKESDSVYLTEGIIGDEKTTKTIISYCKEFDKKIYVEKVSAKYITQHNVMCNNVDVLEWNNYLLEDDGYINLFRIPIPVILVIGTGINCGKFQTLSKLSEFFQKNGYKVLTIGAKVYSELFGFVSIPKFIFEKIDLNTKVMGFNRFVYNNVKNKKPDVVIVEVPGGIIPMNPYLADTYSELNYVISSAVKPDITVLNIHAAIINQELVDEIKKICKYKYGYNVDTIVLSNILHTINISNKRDEYITLTSRDVNNVYDEVDYCIKDNLHVLTNKLSMKKMCDNVINELLNNI